MRSELERELNPLNPNILHAADLATTQAEVRLKAGPLARRLIDDPLLIPDLTQLTQDLAFAAETQGNPALRRTLTRFIQHVGGEITNFDWVSMEHVILPLDAARTILLSLPQSNRRPKEQNVGDLVSEQVAHRIADGYLSKRYEHSERNNWQGSLSTMRTFLESGLYPEPDMEVLTIWFDLMMRKFPHALGPNSLAHRAEYLASVAANPADESTFTLGAHLGQCQRLLNLTLGRNDMEKNQALFRELTNQFQSIRSILLVEGSDLSSGRIRDKLRDLIRVKRRVHFPIAREFIQGLDKDISPDVVEVARDATRFQDRYEALDKFYSSLSDLGNKLLKLQEITAHEALTFPLNAAYQKPPFLEKLYQLVDLAILRKTLNETLDSQLRRMGPSYNAIPFSIEGLQGFAIVNEIPPSSPAERVKRVKELLGKHPFKMDLELRRRILNEPNQPNIGLSYEDVVFLLVSKEFIAKSSLDSFLDLRVPDEQRGRAIDIFRKTIDLRRDLPSRFSRMPTLGGDSYTLRDHTDLPNVIDEVIVRKRGSGGIEFVMTFSTDPLIFPEGEHSSISGTINFQSFRVNVTFDQDTPEIAIDQKWILESVLLHLTEKSCCPPPDEVEEEQDTIKRGNESKRPIPGYVGRVGGYRPNGGRKQFTHQAEVNFAEVVEALFHDTKGISLATINEARWSQFPGDDHYWTYTKGRDVEGELPEPIARSNPTNLL